MFRRIEEGTTTVRDSSDLKALFIAIFVIGILVGGAIAYLLTL